MFRSIAIAAALCFATVTAQAALLGRAALTPGGTDYQAYYDTDLNITWMADANLAASNSFGVSGICTGTYYHCAGAGAMSWDTAQSWIGAMNTANWLGANDWRLPTVTTGSNPRCVYGYSGTNCGYNVDLSTGEMAHMYYSTLGGTGYYNTGGTLSGCNPGGFNWCLATDGPFSNVKHNGFWSGIVYVDGDGGYAWDFRFPLGAQYYRDKGDGISAWAVRDGDIGVVPVPASVYLFGSALGLLGTLRRKISS